MIFSSWEFVVFSIAVLMLFFMLRWTNQHKGLLPLLLLASAVFYASWSIVFYALLVTYAVLGYLAGKRLRKSPSKRFLALSVLLGLSPLLVFKYLPWLTGRSLIEGYIIPLGISFYTFQQIGYLVDSFHRKGADHSLKEYLLFLTFFPQLIAGPIVNNKQMIPQYRAIGTTPIPFNLLSTGIAIFFIGLFKKVVIADNIAPHVDLLFEVPGELSFSDAWAAALGYTCQLYFDFSGYTDMAIGIAMCFGIQLPDNFNSPYKSRSISEFWRRWHITLGAFFKEYVYIPLGGNRFGVHRSVALVILIAVISGIWHGAGLTFFVWGCAHACALAIHKLWSYRYRLPPLLGIVITFVFVVSTWVIFRANSMDDALVILHAMYFPAELNVPSLLAHKIALPSLAVGNIADDGIWMLNIMLLIVVFYCQNTRELIRCNNRNTLVFSYGATLCSVLMLGYSTEFLYFDF
ncbi:MAG: membrane-bound O-acyltransferase family protein [Oleiphilus sp.]|nr:MAG: membrane-bound O-acyltransferase family protein [Oleiphilus sp.]